MEADIGVEDGKVPPCSPTAPDYVPVLCRPRCLLPHMTETAANVDRQSFAVLGKGSAVPAPAAVGLIFGVGLTRMEDRRADGLGP